MPQRPVVVVTSRQRPHELVLLLASVLLGLGYLLTVPPPQSLAAVVPAWLVTTWSVGLLLSGALGLLGAFWRGSILVALELERAALLVSTGALLLIGGASFAVAGWRALFGGSIILAWGVANIVRCVQIGQDTHKLLNP